MVLGNFFEVQLILANGDFGSGICAGKPPSIIQINAPIKTDFFNA